MAADNAKLWVGQEDYYTRELTTDHEQYLSGHGESPGRWYGAGASSLAAFLVGQSILSAERLDISLRQPGVARAVLGSTLFLSAVGLLGLGLGALLRSTAGAVAGLFGLLFGPQLLAGLLPADWSDRVYPYLPVPAGAAVANVQPDPAALAPWTGFGLFCLYTGVVLALAAWQLRRRDA